MNTQILTAFSESEIENLIEEKVKCALEALQPQKEKSDELLTRHEASNILGVSLVTIDKWIRAGILPAKKIKSRIRLFKSDIMDALANVETIKYRRS